MKGATLDQESRPPVSSKPASDWNQDRARGRGQGGCETLDSSEQSQDTNGQQKLQRTAGPAEGRWPGEPPAPKGKKQDIQGPQV